MFKIGDNVKVVRDCNGKSYNDCAYCPPVGLVGTIVKMARQKFSGVEKDVACLDTYHNGQGRVECDQLEHIGE